MKEEFPFSLKSIRTDVDSEEIGFRLYGEKAKPVHFATGFFRGILGKYATTDLLSRLVYVVNARGQVKQGCEIEDIMAELQSEKVIEDGISKTNVQALRGMMQSLLNADQAVFGEKGSFVSYSAASAPFVTGKATYEEVGEIGAGILKTACPELAKTLETLLLDTKDEISTLFAPVPCEMVSASEDCGQLPGWVSKTNKHPAWDNFISSVKCSGTFLKHNISGQPKLLAIRTIVHFAIFHLIRYLAKQESFHDKNAPSVIPLLAVYAKNRRPALAASSRSSFLQVGQSMARFYALMYAKRFTREKMDSKKLLSMQKAPPYDEKKTLTAADKKRALQNDETWKTAKNMAGEEATEKLKILRLGRAIHDMVATASDVSPSKYIRGLALKSGILYPPTPRIIPYFRFSQDITSMLVFASVENEKGIAGDIFLQNLRDNFDVVTGALGSDFSFCTEHLRTMRVDEDELNANGEAFIDQICDMGYGTILADGIFRVSIGE